MDQPRGAVEREPHPVLIGTLSGRLDRYFVRFSAVAESSSPAEPTFFRAQDNREALPRSTI
jgi:hypothetical protein